MLLFKLFHPNQGNIVTKTQELLGMEKNEKKISEEGEQ